MIARSRQVGALMRRDVLIEISYPMGPIVRFVSVLIITVSLFYVDKLVNAPPELERYGSRYFEFVMLGFVLAWFASNGLGSFAKSVGDDLRNGTLESLLVAPVGIPTWLSGALVVPFGLTLIQIVVYLAAGIALFDANLDVGGAGLALPFLALGIVSFGALGVLSAAFTLITKRGDPVTILLAQATTYFAGGLFPTSLLPGPLEAVTRVVPAYWALDGLRRTLLAGAGFADVRGALLALCALTALLVPLSLACFRWSVALGRRTGTLATY